MCADMVEATRQTSVDALQRIRETRELVARISPAIRRGGLSLEAFLALSALQGASPRGLSMSELAKSTGATPPTLTRHIDTLAARSMVYREIDVRDRRSTVIHISKIGRAAISRIDEQLDAMV
ncbi:MarR family protein [Propionibacterium cyclohexanicum]|uniref:MarR family protein n=1 Tax=Propionibacterium cyclohexanicum TaxID=64702 RepID=A0A1H9TYB0_9ACTN|nr:MarR family transcriptional regulator [Propionibacterium cyclohexanicum]SES02109.1 MarR family protein [Propionibacterium cyclohexanicum]